MRWLIRLIGVVVLLAGLAATALLVLPADRIAALAADRLSATLGREVRISGEVSPTLWPQLGIRAEGLRVGNPDWVTQGPLIEAEALSVRVPWSALFGGALSIEEITLVDPDITLVRGADGRVSWAMPGQGTLGQGAPEPAPAASSPTMIGVSSAEITGGRLVYLDAVSGQRLELSDLDGQLRVARTGAASVSARGLVNGTGLSIAGEIADLPALLDGSLSGLELALDWTGGVARFDGALGLAPAFDGDLSVEATDLAPLLSVLGAVMPDLPSGYGRDSLSLTGRITLAHEGSAHLRNGRLGLDGTELALDLDVLPGADRPMLRGSLSGARLTLPEAQAETPPSGPAEGAAGWSRTPMNVSGLFAADADIALALDEVSGRGLTAGPVAIRARLDRGRLVLDLERVGVYGGALAGEFVVNGRGGLSVGGDLRLVGVDLSPLLTDLAAYDRLNGTGGARLRFLGVGDDVATIMSGLEGEGDIALGAGAIEGLDLAGMIRTLDTSYRGEGARTVYDRIAGSFTIADGILVNDDLRLDAPWGEVTGAGRVNLGVQALDYRLVPGVLTGADGGGVRVPVRITGPWSDPSIRPDLEYLAEQEFAEERARLEAEAQARIDAEAERFENAARERVNEVLGTGFDSETTPEAARDEVERRLREEAERAILRLLGQGD